VMALHYHQMLMYGGGALLGLILLARLLLR
jgi:hypothetical protein